MKIRLICDSCGEEMKLDEKIYEDHVIKNHPKKVNVKWIFFNASILREI